MSVLVAIATEKMGAIRRLRDMREALPTDGRLGAWVESLRSGGTQAPPDLAATAAAAADVASATAATTEAGGAAATAVAHLSAAVVIAAGAVIGGVNATPRVSDSPPPASSAPADTARYEPGGPERATAVPEDPAQHRAVAPIVLGLPDAEPISVPGATAVSPEVDIVVGDADVTDDLDPVGTVEQTRLPSRVQETAEQIDATLPDPEGTTGEGLATDAEETVDAGTVGAETEATSTTAPGEHVAPESATDPTEDTVESSHQDGLSAVLDG